MTRTPIASWLLVVAITTNDAKTSAFLFAAAAGLATFGSGLVGRRASTSAVNTLAWFRARMNTFGNLGSTAMPLLMGLGLKWWNSWYISLMTVAFFYLFSTACWLGIDPEEPIPNS